MYSSKKKKIIACLLACSFMLICAFPASAEINYMHENVNSNSIIQPRLNYIEAAETGLDIDNGVAIVDCWVKGNVLNATKAKVIAELQLKSGNNWMAYGTWTDTQNDYEASVYETKSVKSGNTYRVKATYTVWEGSQSETIIVFSDEATV